MEPPGNERQPPVRTWGKDSAMGSIQKLPERFHMHPEGSNSSESSKSENCESSKVPPISDLRPGWLAVIYRDPMGTCLVSLSCMQDGSSFGIEAFG